MSLEEIVYNGQAIGVVRTLALPEGELKQVKREDRVWHLAIQQVGDGTEELITPATLPQDPGHSEVSKHYDLAYDCLYWVYGNVVGVEAHMQQGSRELGPLLWQLRFTKPVHVVTCTGTSPRGDYTLLIELGIGRPSSHREESFVGIDERTGEIIGQSRLGLALEGAWCSRRIAEQIPGYEVSTPTLGTLN